MPGENSNGPKPTVVTPPPRRKRVAAPATPAASATPPAGLQPTAIPGTERKRIAVTASQLRALSPGCDAATCERALALLAGFVVEKASERKAILWGHDIQRAYSELVTETLALSQTPIFRKVEGYVGRMVEILSAIDVAAASGAARGGIASVFRGVNNRIDTPEELAVAQRELDLLVKHLGQGLDELLDLKDRLESQAADLERLAGEAEAGALAALFLAQHFEREKPGLAQCFTQRSMSLTQTLAQIRQNDTVREIQIKYPLRLVSVIQDVALVAMPDVIASIASVVTLVARKASLSPTEAGELNYKLRDILGKLAVQEGR
jgi:hypothetical protein